MSQLPSGHAFTCSLDVEMYPREGHVPSKDIISLGIVSFY